MQRLKTGRRVTPCTKVAVKSDWMENREPNACQLLVCLRVKRQVSKVNEVVEILGEEGGNGSAYIIRLQFRFV